MIDAIFATDGEGGFGYERTMPWPKNKKDMEHFQKVTHNTCIVMGRKTADSMPLPLPYRIPIILSSNPHPDFSSLDYTKYDVIDTLRDAQTHGVVGRCVLVGGLSVLTLENLKRCDNIYYTAVKGTFESTVKMDKSILEWLNNHDNKETLYEDNLIKITKVVNE